MPKPSFQQSRMVGRPLIMTPKRNASSPLCATSSLLLYCKRDGVMSLHLGVNETDFLDKGVRRARQCGEPSPFTNMVPKKHT